MTMTMTMTTKKKNKFMYTGRDTIEWLYGHQFKLDGEWSVPTERGFRWWPTDRAQTVEVVGEAYGPSGVRGYYISVHIKNIYEECELMPEATVKKYLTVRTEGNREVKRLLDYYNLDMIISVGYRVNSLLATLFRIKAAHLLRSMCLKYSSMLMTT